jgi:hypothetical protein
MERWSKWWFAVLVVGGWSLAAPLVWAAGPAAGPERRRPAETGQMLDVREDRDKTVYTIGPSPAGSGRDDTDRAWDMLNNVVIDARGTNGQRPDNYR